MKRMILIAATIMAALMTCSVANAQDKNAPAPAAPAVQPSGFSSIDGARFELVVPKNNTTEYTYRIDKFTGEVWLVYGIKQYMTLVRDASDNDVQYENTINYQLYAIAGDTAYLLNLNTGVVWEFYNFGFKTSNRLVLVTPR